MKNLSEKIQTAANVAIILTAFLLGGVLIQRYFFAASAKPATPENEALKAGTKVPLADVDWSKSDKNLLLVISSSCRYCTESVPFYQKLVQQKAGRDDVKMVAVMPQSVSEAQKYLNENKIPIEEIRQTTPNSINVKGTPTLILVDKTGAVVQSWVGKLPPEKEVEVLNQLFGGEHANHKH